MPLLYDGTFDGLLTAIFECYRLGITPTRILPEYDWQETLFDTPVTVATRPDQAGRVRRGLARLCTKKAVRLLYRAYLTEQADIEMLIYRFVRLTTGSGENILDNYREEVVLELHELNKKIGREVHRMHAFVRFQRSRDDLYFAVIEPDFNVLPLIGDHFVKRYPAQEWLIYDARRRYGLHYDLQTTSFITLESERHQQLQKLLTKDIIAEDESAYQQLWQDYFTSVDIPERRNMKLHLQHVPRRYWKYLVEKG